MHLFSYDIGAFPQVVKGSRKVMNFQTSEPSVLEEDIGEPASELYGKWQLEPLQLPHAVNGIVPKVRFYFHFLNMIAK